MLCRNVKVKILKTIILQFVLCGCETWSLTLREEHRLRVLENSVVRRIFGAKRDEITEEWRKLYNEEFHILYSSPDIICRPSQGERWARHVACRGEGGKVKGNLPLGRQRLKWEDVIRMDLGQNGWRVVFSWLGIGTGGGLL
jgi:hypothetical protein